MASEVFQDFPDTDGNFVEQFQTTGFDARVFELYLYAYLSRSGYRVERAGEGPDYIVTKDGTTVALEATTVNPNQSAVDNSHPRGVEPTPDEHRARLENEIPIRFGSPLFSKLNRKYWELERCRAIPIVLAVEAFWEEGSLYFSDSSLGQYLYGLRHYPDWTEDGHLVVKSKEIVEHTWGTKVIPSDFFGQPDAEHISAVLFCNSGTYAKFCRMGYQAGYYRGDHRVVRWGTCYDADPDATEPLTFHYEVDDPPVLETWGQGLTVFRNPRALFPLPRGYLVDAADSYLEDGRIKADVPSFHPFMSQTVFTKVEREPFGAPVAATLPIESILRCEFDALKPERHPLASAVVLEKEWFADRQRTVLGALLLDRTDDDWAYVVLGRDKAGVFRWIAGEHSIGSRDTARDRLVDAMREILASGQSVFPQE